MLIISTLVINVLLIVIGKTNILFRVLYYCDNSVYFSKQIRLSSPFLEQKNKIYNLKVVSFKYYFYLCTEIYEYDI